MNDEVFVEVTLDIPRERALDITPMLDNGLPEKMTGYFEVLFEDGRRSDRSVMMLYFPAGYSAATADVTALALAAGIEDSLISETSIHRQDYMQAYKAHYEPIRLSRRFGVIPGWHKDTIKEQEFRAGFDELIPLYLDPGLAFGTGRHATTKMMIEFIDGIDWRGLKVLDAGCGSGILALAALKLGAEHATAFDIDGNAVHATSMNLRSNGIPEEAFQVLEGGWDIPQLADREFDVILANITLNIFVEYRSVINTLHAPRLIVSGVLVEMKDRFLELYGDHWRCVGEATEDGWLRLDLVSVR